MKPQLRITLVDAEDKDETPMADPLTYEGVDLRVLNRWVDTTIRLETCRQVHPILSILQTSVYFQALDRGWNDAMEIGESRLSEHADPLWKSGYETGFSNAMSERTDAADGAAGGS